MKTYEMTTRQVCFILVAYNACGKLLLYPAELAATSGNGLLFSALINIALQTAVVWAAAFLCTKTDYTFFQLLKNTLGGIGSRIVAALFAAFFALAALYPILENKLYVHTVFYDTVPPLVVFLPFFILSTYVGAKGLRNAARCADICLPLFIAAIFIIFVMSVGQFKVERLLPVTGTPLKDILKGALGTVHYFTEGAFVLMFMGRFKCKRGDCAKITISYVLGGAVVLLFLALLYGVFGGTTADELFAISKISAYFPSAAVIGRTDFIALYALEIITLFYIALNIQLCVEALCHTFKTERRDLLSLVLNAVLLVLIIALNNYFQRVSSAYYNWLWIAFLPFAFAAPPLARLLRRGK